MAAFQVGDRVQVPYQEVWYAGVICKIDAAAGHATIQCDVDAPGVTTSAPLSCLSAEIKQAPAIDTSKPVVCRIRLPNGEAFLECPLCLKQFKDDENGESTVLKHVASVHGQAWTSADGKHTGDSEQLDMLNASCDANYHARHLECKKRVHVVSLGSFCGMKFTIQRLGLGAAHMPFDWIRTTANGLRYFFNNNFEKFFTVASRTNVKSANLTVHRSEMHSFWHDDISKSDVRSKLQRRIDRFTALKEDSKDLLFIRSATCTAELADTEDLYSALVSFFGAGKAGQTRRILLVIIVTGQDEFEGPILHKVLPGVIFFLQPVASDAEMMEGRAFERAVTFAIELALAAPVGSDPCVGFGQMLGIPCRTVASAAALLEGDGAAKASDVGLQSGYDGLMCFEQPNTAHVDLSNASEDVVLPSALQ